MLCQRYRNRNRWVREVVAYLKWRHGRKQIEDEQTQFAAETINRYARYHKSFIIFDGHRNNNH